MSFLLDTCIISELVRPRPQPSVVSWIEAADEQSLFLSVLTLGELEVRDSLEERA
jgi:predicted nucleic acid-binding protein